MNYRISAPERLEGAIVLPASKSISNRVLLLHALSGGKGSLHHLAKCDDTDAVLRALAHDDAQVVDIGAAGTAMRFLTAYFATREGRCVTLTGTERMRQRPIKVLVEALRCLQTKGTVLLVCLWHIQTKRTVPLVCGLEAEA